MKMSIKALRSLISEAIGQTSMSTQIFNQLLQNPKLNDFIVELVSTAKSDGKGNDIERFYRDYIDDILQEIFRDRRKLNDLLARSVSEILDASHVFNASVHTPARLNIEPDIDFIDVQNVVLDGVVIDSDVEIPESSDLVVDQIFRALRRAAMQRVQVTWNLNRHPNYDGAMIMYNVNFVLPMLRSLQVELVRQKFDSLVSDLLTT